MGLIYDTSSPWCPEESMINGIILSYRLLGDQLADVIESWGWHAVSMIARDDCHYMNKL